MLTHLNSSFFTKMVLGLAALLGLLFFIPSLSAVFPTGDALPPAPSANMGLIAFIAENDGNKDLYVMNPDGSGLQQLTHTAKQENAPVWAPDGQSLAFESGRDIYRLRLGETSSRFFLNRIGRSNGIQDLKWSPDGTQILFHLSCGDAEAFTLYLMNADSSNPHCLDLGPLKPTWSAWSPDSTQIVFTATADVSKNTDIYVINADGTNLRQLTDDSALDVEPQWSPDGTQIYFMAYHPGLNPSTLSLYVMNADGSDRRTFFQRREGGCHRSRSQTNDEERLGPISPDGQSALVTIRRGSEYSVVIVDLDTMTQTTRLQSEMYGFWDLEWSPDSQQIIYRAENMHYYMMAVDGSWSQSLNVPFEHVSGVTWQPVQG